MRAAPFPGGEKPADYGSTAACDGSPPLGGHRRPFYEQEQLNAALNYTSKPARSGDRGTRRRQVLEPDFETTKDQII